MDQGAASTAALTIAVATAAGVVAQSAARMIGVPGIVLLLITGVLLGPDVAGLLDPGALGSALPQLVSFAVAVILFEGGMHLKIGEFRTCSRSIRRLITWGALLTFFGATLFARGVLGWDWRVAGLFGSLVIVTGPTVVTPLVRRFRLIPTVRTVLEGEGILIDSVGAVVAVVALEVALEPTSANLAMGVLGVATRLGIGVVLGAAGGGLMWLALRYHGLVAEGLENVFMLAMVWALMQGSEVVIHESGVAAVTAAGMVVGNLRVTRHRELLEFNNQLTLMLIGMLFVLLAADVRISAVAALGVRGLVVVVLLVFVVRPVAVFLCLVGSRLSLAARAYVAWIGPRGIIAAAIASLFASTLDREGIEGAKALQAMVFLVIGVTVVLAGLSGGLVAGWLGVRAEQKGWLLLGAGEVSCFLGRCLREANVEVACIDNSVQACRSARKRGIDVITGNGIEDDVLQQASINLREGAAALTPNDEINLLFIRKARRLGGLKRTAAALHTPGWGATKEMIYHARGRILFGAAHDVALWSGRMRAGEVLRQVFVAGNDARLPEEDHHESCLAVVSERRGSVVPITDDMNVQQGDRVTFLVVKERLPVVFKTLQGLSWLPEGDALEPFDAPPSQDLSG